MFLSRIVDLISTIASVTLWHFDIVSRWGLIPIPWVTTWLTSKRHGLCFGFVWVTAWGCHTAYFNETWKTTNYTFSDSVSTKYAVLKIDLLNYLLR